jgi:EAL domain-containing protein (putative c-di-GMP-specific phosphodiesterase class I)
MPLSAPPASREQSHRDRFLNFAFAAADLLVEVGPDTAITWAAGAFASRFGHQADNYLRHPVEELVAPADRPALAHSLALATLHGRLAPLILRLNDPQQTRCAMGALAVPDRAGRLCLTFGAVPAEPPPMATVATEQGALAAQAEAGLRAGQKRALNLLDVDGWAEGNAHLTVAERAALRRDIASALAGQAGPDVLVADMGPGRFGVLGDSDLDLGALTATIRTALGPAPGAAARVNGQTIPLSLPGLTPGQASRALRYALSRFADGGLAAVASAGFTNGLAGFIAAASGQAAALRARIAGRKFRLLYQPVVALADRVPHHYEALLRPFPGGEGPVLSTQELVTFAEAMGLAEELDLAVAQEALLTLAETERVRVAVNVSGLSMQSPSFRQQFMAMVVPGSRLIVELTETADITDTEVAADMLRTLRAAGVEVCIDDFGAGSAAFRYLRDFRVDFVKIDGAYVRAATAGPREQGFVESMRDLAHAVGAGVIAEMVETEAEAALMARLGVRFAQGYLFGRPGQLPGARRQ